MPIQDGKYVSPDWSNSSPPPINASELNALSETVEKADTNERLLHSTELLFLLVVAE